MTWSKWDALNESRRQKGDAKDDKNEFLKLQMENG